MLRAAAPAVRRVLLLGGTSEIGLAIVAALGLPATAEVVLAGRDAGRLAAVAGGLPCVTRVEGFDAGDPTDRRQVVERAFAAGPVDLVIPAFGVLGDQLLAERDPAHAEHILEVDLLAQATVLLAAAARLREQGHGTIVVLSSVAMVRPRRANFVYGAGKAGLDALARGLADSLHGSGVRVLIVRPGFVTGRMTAGMRPAPLSCRPEDVGRAVAAALRSGRATVWVPPALRLLAVALRLVPRPLWRRIRR
ncbi:MAG TPA: SDR family NAD(P)-dependent oxidoreductase [Mycobacteriales bacterium]|nr:SDR family NAD(P)-dependent oxidoreductase [Mycobacteriales bacterium]